MESPKLKQDGWFLECYEWCFPEGSTILCIVYEWKVCITFNLPQVLSALLWYEGRCQCITTGSLLMVHAVSQNRSKFRSNRRTNLFLHLSQCMNPMSGDLAKQIRTSCDLYYLRCYIAKKGKVRAIVTFHASVFQRIICFKVVKSHNNNHKKSQVTNTPSLNRKYCIIMKWK